MFGYVKPFLPELKLKDYALYRAVYCSLCRMIRTRYGLVSTRFLSYDMTFLALLSLSAKSSFSTEKHPCSVNPFKKHSVVEDDAVIPAADASIVLYYHKLRDTAIDAKGIKKLGAKAALLLFRRAYRRAGTVIPAYDAEVRLQLDRLNELEKANSASIDATSDCFGKILSALAPMISNGRNPIPFEQLLYFIGKYIYLVDAADDLSDDLKNGDYNPIAVRRHLSLGDYETQYHGEVRQMLLDNLSAAALAFELAETESCRDLLGNIIYPGLTGIVNAVLDGTYDAKSSVVERGLRI